MRIILRGRPKHTKATKQRREELQRYVTQLLPYFHLTSWQVAVSEEQADEKAHIEVSCIDYYDEATIRVSPEFFDTDLETQRREVCHEIIHLLLRDLASVYLNLAHRLGEAEQSVVEYHEEQFVDRVAGIVAPIVPLPQWSWETKRGRLKTRDI